MTISFSCQHCGKTLSTSDDKAGRKAKCPGCGEVIAVPAAAVGGDESVDMVPDDDAVDVPAPPTRPTQRESSKPKSACPMCGAPISSSASRCDACGEPLEPRRRIGSEPQMIEAGNVMSEAFSEFGSNLGIAVGAYLVFVLLIFAAAIPAIGLAIAMGAMADQRQANEPPVVLMILMIPAILVFIAVALYLQPGLLMVYLGLARGDKVGIGTLFSGGRYVLKFTLCSIVFGMIVGLGTIACIIPGIILALRYWTFAYIILDDDPPGLECFSRAAELSRGNWGSVLIIGIVGFVINFIAQLVCGIITLFTQPLQSTFFAMAYVKMSGQRR